MTLLIALIPNHRESKGGVKSFDLGNLKHRVEDFDFELQDFGVES
jgi:hypothetical protein